ncbi:MAG: MoaD/ThiS family protein [Deltaproteobacteria bacterium]|jgi:MoaD family protein|nr:MoaD/ThiS family protein [Deltaproteobacteria bacterium]MBT4526594.1 MoaD/ThiS family protein [Deltaproteobacteria bacterium]
MRIHIKYLVNIRELTGKKQEYVDFPNSSTLKDFADWLQEQYALVLPSRSIMTLLNGKNWNCYPEKIATKVQDGDEIVLFPPISGG